MNKEYIDGFNKGREHGRNSFIVDIFEMSRQREFLKFLYCYTAAPEKDKPDTRTEREIGFNAGIRAALRVISFLGEPSDSFKDIINPDITFNFTREDFDKYNYRFD